MASVIIVAAGSGLRMKSSRKKQYLVLNGMTVIARTLRRFDSCPFIESIMLVVPNEDIDYCISEILPEAACIKKITVTAGGRERPDSVRAGLDAVIPSEDRIVMIHDGVRPFVSDEIIRLCIEGALKYGACIPAMQVSDTVKYSEDGFFTEKTVSRSSLWLAQTPQAFDYNIILNAHRVAAEKKNIFTDDASLLENMGIPVKIITGSRLNLKITHPEDFKIAQAILSMSAE